jgi:hypothetical protein
MLQWILEDWGAMVWFGLSSDRIVQSFEHGKETCFFREWIGDRQLPKEDSEGVANPSECSLRAAGADVYADWPTVQR